MAPNTINKKNKSTLFDSFLKIINSFSKRGTLVKEQKFTRKNKSKFKDNKNWDIATKETLSTLP